MQNKQFVINTITTAVNLVIHFAISFFLTSYLVNAVGSTAYGFYGMANNIVNYALIVTNALNSLSARFIGIGVHNKDYKSAKMYYSSVFAGDLVFALIILLPSCFAIYNLEHLIHIPSELMFEVKLLFLIIFLNMCVNIVFSAFGCVYTIKNRLDITALLQLSSNIVKSAILIVLYVLLKPSIVYLGVATLIATLIIAFGNLFFTKKYMPEIGLDISFAKLKGIKEIVTSGIWNSLNQLSITLLNGLDLLIANLMVSAEAMGVLSIAGTIPGVISTFISSLSNMFTPKYLELYSHGDYPSLLKEVKNSIRFMTVVSVMPISFLIAFGVPFFKLWTPNTDIKMLYILSVIIILPHFSGGAINSVNYLYTVANKIKWPAIILLLTGVTNVVTVFVCLKFTSLGVYAIAGVSTVIGFLRNIFFNAPYAARCIKKPIYTFWPDMLKSLVCLLFAVAVGTVVNGLFKIDTWLKLILIGGICTAFTGLLVAIAVLSKEQKHFVISKIKGAIQNGN